MMSPVVLILAVLAAFELVAFFALLSVLIGKRRKEKDWMIEIQRSNKRGNTIRR